MISFRRTLIVLLLVCGAAHAATLIPVDEPLIAQQFAALEVNQGQTAQRILALYRGKPSIGVARQSILFSPIGARQEFVASNPDPTVRFSDSLPGVVNDFTGSDPGAWITGIPRFAAVDLIGIYPGIDARYEVGEDGALKLKFLIQPGAAPESVVFEVPEAARIFHSPDGETLRIRFGHSVLDPSLLYARPQVSQQTAEGPVNRSAAWEVQSSTRFGLVVEGRDDALALHVEMVLGQSGFLPLETPASRDEAGNVYAARPVPDAAGKDDPFPNDPYVGCVIQVGIPVTCTDVAVYRISEQGEFVYVSYLSGGRAEDVGFFGLAPNGELFLAGSTSSEDFPVTSQALQAAYAGPFPARHTSLDIRGDIFAARLNPFDGIPHSSTYLGGLDADTMNEAALGPDGSLYFLPKRLGHNTAGMPTSPGALQADCDSDDPCLNGYVARLSPSLDTLVFGTYFPGVQMATAKLNSDGSVYYGGRAEGGFPTTPTALQRETAGGIDGTVARLDPSGELIFGTYIGGPDTNWVTQLTVALDGSAWVDLTSCVQCGQHVDHRLIRIDALGEQVLAEWPSDLDGFAVGPEGNLFTITAGDFALGPNPLLETACPLSNLTYLKLSPSGEQLFATRLPHGTRTTFGGTSDRGLPIIRTNYGRFEIIEGDSSMGVFAGCLLNAANLTPTLSAGTIVTLFGTRLGPLEGVGFQLENGRVPTTLGGTQVFVNNEAIPILFSSYGQVNAILPYSIVSGAPAVRVEVLGELAAIFESNSMDLASIAIFQLDDSPDRPAAALNEDGTVNSPSNPARKGSWVALFGTGGGATVPVSEAGELTPLELRPLDQTPRAFVGIVGGQELTVGWAGGAPSLVAGVTQFNVKLPGEMPQTPDWSEGLLPVRMVSPGGSSSTVVTVVVHSN